MPPGWQQLVIDLDGLDPGEIEASGKQKRQAFGLKQGIDRDAAKKIVKMIKEKKLKVQAQAKPLLTI